MTIVVLSNTQHISTAYTLNSTFVLSTANHTSLMNACLSIIGEQHTKAIFDIQHSFDFKERLGSCGAELIFGAITAFLNTDAYAHNYYDGDWKELNQTEGISLSTLDLTSAQKFLLGPQDLIASLDSIVDQFKNTNKHAQTVKAFKLFKSAVVYCLACERAGIDASTHLTEFCQADASNKALIIENIKNLLLEQNISTKNFLDIEQTYKFLYGPILRKFKTSMNEDDEFLKELTKTYSDTGQNQKVHVAITSTIQHYIYKTPIKTTQNLPIKNNNQLVPTQQTANAVNFQVAEFLALELNLRLKGFNNIAEILLFPITNRITEIYFGSKTTEVRNFNKHFKMKTRSSIVHRKCSYLRAQYQAYIPIKK